MLKFFGQVMSPHHSDNMSQGSQVSHSALWQCFSKVCRFLAVICYPVPGGYLLVTQATYRAVHLFSEGQLEKYNDKDN